jgi:hypothetical protein
MKQPLHTLASCGFAGSDDKLAEAPALIGVEEPSEHERANDASGSIHPAGCAKRLAAIVHPCSDLIVAAPRLRPQSARIDNQKAVPVNVAKEKLRRHRIFHDDLN